jgi:hypothetical protein
MLRRLFLCCGLWIGLWSAGASAQEPAAPVANTPAPPTAEPPAAAPVAAEPPAAAAPVAQPPAAAPAPAPAPPAAVVVATPQPTRDPERAPTHELVEPPPGFFVRLALGIGVALLTTGEVSDLRLPSSVQLDFGYGFSHEFAALLRAGSWFSYDPFALHFLGAGIRYGFQPEGMFVNALLGASISDGEFGFQGSEDESIQGLALHLEVGQRFPIAEVADFEIGAHFELGTPLFASDLEFTSIGVGPFVALRWPQ